MTLYTLSLFAGFSGRLLTTSGWIATAGFHPPTGFTVKNATFPGGEAFHEQSQEASADTGRCGEMPWRCGYLCAATYTGCSFSFLRKIHLFGTGDLAPYPRSISGRVRTNTARDVFHGCSTGRNLAFHRADRHSHHVLSGIMCGGASPDIYLVACRTMSIIKCGFVARLIIVRFPHPVSDHRLARRLSASDEVLDRLSADHHHSELHPAGLGTSARPARHGAFAAGKTVYSGRPNVEASPTGNIITRHLLPNTFSCTSSWPRP